MISPPGVGPQRAQGPVARPSCPVRSAVVRSDLAQFEKLKAEGLDLGKDTEHRGLIFEHAGEHGLTAVQLGHHRGEGGQSSRSEPTPYPDRVQTRRRGHTVIVLPDLVNRRRRNPVIGHADPWLFRRCWRRPVCQEPQLAGALNGSRPVARTEFGIEVADVSVDRVDRDVQIMRDFCPRQVCRKKSQDAQLAGGELTRAGKRLAVGARR